MSTFILLLKLVHPKRAAPGPTRLRGRDPRSTEVSETLELFGAVCEEGHWGLGTDTLGDSDVRRAKLCSAIPLVVAMRRRPLVSCIAWGVVVGATAAFTSPFGRRVPSVSNSCGAVAVNGGEAYGGGDGGSSGGPSSDAWAPPSQNASKKKGNVFVIEGGEDLLQFISEDERLSVGESQEGTSRAGECRQISPNPTRNT